jgi:hypothetical protein
VPAHATARARRAAAVAPLAGGRGDRDRRPGHVRDQRLPDPGPTSDTPVPFDNPFGQPGLLGQVAKGTALAGLALHVASLLAALLCVIVRFRASRGVERQQLRWVATGATIAGLGVTVPLGDLRGAWVDPVVVLCVPLAVAVAVLRYRLWDLDRLVSRTVT